MDAVQPQYAKTEDGTHVAYAVIGDGPLDLVFVPGFVSHIEAGFRFDASVRFFERLASFARVIVFDKRGTGLSDPVADAGVPLDVRMDDLRAVMDAAGSEQAAFFAVSEGGPLSLMFAATYPERTVALALFGSLARLLEDPPDYPIGYRTDAVDQFIAANEATWGTPAMMYVLAPSITDDPALMDEAAGFMRQAASPKAAIDLIRWWGQIDVRDVLPTIRAPTLVLHRSGDLLVPLELSRYLAANIAGARMVELDGADHNPIFGDANQVLDELQQFLTGQSAPAPADRVLATVLFTDIVGSTERAADLGDSSWRAVLDRHDDLAHKVVERHRGRIVKSTGDGLLATFDGPARAIGAARELVEALAAIGLPIRAGLHTGEVELRGDDVGGLAVHLGARVSAVAGGNEVLVSRTVKDLVVGSGIEFEDRGLHELKGVPDEWQLFAVVGP